MIVSRAPNTKEIEWKLPLDPEYIMLMGIEVDNSTFKALSIPRYGLAPWLADAVDRKYPDPAIRVGPNHVIATGSVTEHIIGLLGYPEVVRYQMNKSFDCKEITDDYRALQHFGHLAVHVRDRDTAMLLKIAVGDRLLEDQAPHW